MIIIRLIGGLGNQMFQYAFGKALAARHGTELKIDVEYLHGLNSDHSEFVPRKYNLDIFNIPDKFASKDEIAAFTKRTGNALLDRLLDRVMGYKKSYVREPQYNFSASLLESPDNILLEGYWQCSRYFNEMESELKQIFTFKHSPEPEVQAVLQEIKNRNSVCVHVRRGDFLTNPNHSFCGLPYYQHADEIIRQKISEPAYFVFSDDINWCEENMQFLRGAKFIPSELAGHKDQDHLRMMSACRHFIIPNSSFAWWAVWLNNNKDAVVIAPDNWYKAVPGASDMYQPGWIIL